MRKKGGDAMWCLLLPVLVEQFSSRVTANDARLIRKQSVGVLANGMFFEQEGGDSIGGTQSNSHVTITAVDVLEHGESPSRCNVMRPFSNISVDDVCPEQCRFRAEVAQHFCHFKCVTGAECGRNQSGTMIHATVADRVMGICRGCTLKGCKVCKPHADECLECNEEFGFVLGGDKQCRSAWVVVPTVIYLSVLCIGGYFIIWYVNIVWWRRKTNLEEETWALHFRTATKNCQPDEAGMRESEQRVLWPLSTNILTTDVAGPGSVLFFRFQVFAVVLPFLLFLLWCSVAAATDLKLLSLGTELPTTPQERCTAVSEGRHFQMQSMRTKLFFLVCAYVLTFMLTMVFASYQRRTFQMLDDQATHSDFALFLEGVPEVKGAEKLEEILKDAVAEATNQTVVGVSVGWDYAAHSANGTRIGDLLEEAMVQAEEQYTERREAQRRESQTQSAGADGVERRRSQTQNGGEDIERRGSQVRNADVGVDGLSSPILSASEGEERRASQTQNPGIVEEGMANRSGLFALLDYALLELVFGIPVYGAESGPMEDGDQATPEDLAMQCTSSSMAFAVFESQAARDAALALGSFTFREQTVTLRYLDVEPEGVRWRDFGIPRSQLMRNTFMSILFILGGIVAWVVCGYFPYAIYASSFTYEDGDMPSGLMAQIVSMVVVIGNLVMYTLCAAASDRIGFILEDTAAATYMIMYTVAVMCNICLDLLISGMIAYTTSVSRHARTFDGRRIQDLGSWHDVIEAYDIQRELGVQLSAYCFPATFLLPYILEPICANWFTFHLARRVVRVFPWLRGYTAEKAMRIFIPMDSGRYADLLVSITMATFIFFVPSGYSFSILLTLTLSNLYIFFLDIYRILRACPSFSISSMFVDQCALYWMCIPTTIIANAFIFKWNTEQCHLGNTCYRSSELAGIMISVTILLQAMWHVAFCKVVPLFDRKERPRTHLTYEKVAARLPASFFNTNPMFCLRSEYLYKHDPPCQLLIKGKEHVLQKNPSIGSHFEDHRTIAKEDYWIW